MLNFIGNPKQKSKHFITRCKDLSQPLLIVPFFGVILASCSGQDKYDFKDSKDALNCYHNYLYSVRNIKQSNTNNFIQEVTQWKEVNDTIIRYLIKDSTLLKNHNVSAELNLIHDSVRYEMLRISETWRYGYEDVLMIKEATSQFHNDKELLEAVNDAEPLFISMNEVPILDTDKNSILNQYRAFLNDIKLKGIKTTEDMLSFIRKEDVFFRSFLAHLDEMENEPISDITRDTEYICKNIFVTAREGKIPARDAMVYMSMRTVRRLLQNSVVCISDINNQEIKNQTQGNAYVWMVIQPFISIDQFSIATLTPTERSNFKYIITNLPKSTKFAKTFNVEQRSLNYLLPQQLLKIYILSL